MRKLFLALLLLNLIIPSAKADENFSERNQSGILEKAIENEGFSGFIKRNNPKFWEFSLEPNEAIGVPELYYLDKSYTDPSSYKILKDSAGTIVNVKDAQFEKYLVVFKNNIPPFAQTNLQRAVRGKYGFYRVT